MSKPKQNAITLVPAPAEGQAALQVGQAVRLEGRLLFLDYYNSRTERTRRKQRFDFDRFTAFLGTMRQDEFGDFQKEPAAWKEITSLMVRTFVQWQLVEGYSISTINGSLATIRVYAKLAHEAGVLSEGELAKITNIKSFGYGEGQVRDENRLKAHLPVRREGSKKANPVKITDEQAMQLIARPENAQGRRDALLMCLLLELGLRAGEVALLKVEDFDLKRGTLTFHRPKVHKKQTHQLPPVTLKAARAYFKYDVPPSGSVWRKSTNSYDGKDTGALLEAQGLSARSITRKVAEIGEENNIPGLSAHDLRHYWATAAVRHHTPIDRLKQAGGWNSVAMPMRYVLEEEIANAGVAHLSTSDDDQ